MLVFGHGVEFPGRITAYGLIRTHDFLGAGDGVFSVRLTVARESSYRAVAPGGQVSLPYLVWRHPSSSFSSSTSSA